MTAWVVTYLLVGVSLLTHIWVHSLEKLILSVCIRSYFVCSVYFCLAVCVLYHASHIKEIMFLFAKAATVFDKNSRKTKLAKPCKVFFKLYMYSKKRTLSLIPNRNSTHYGILLHFNLWTFVFYSSERYHHFRHGYLKWLTVYNPKLRWKLSVLAFQWYVGQGVSDWVYIGKRMYALPKRVCWPIWVHNTIRR